MNGTGMATAMMSLLLLLSVCGSVVRSSGIANAAWISMRSAFYMAGVLLSAYYFHYLMGTHATNQVQLSSLRWNNFVPLVASVFGLVQSMAVWRTRSQSDGYAPHLEAEDLAFRGERSS